MVLCCQSILEIRKESGLFVLGIAPRGYKREKQMKKQQNREKILIR